MPDFLFFGHIPIVLFFDRCNWHYMAFDKVYQFAFEIIYRSTKFSIFFVYITSIEYIVVLAGTALVSCDDGFAKLPAQSSYVACVAAMLLFPPKPSIILCMYVL